MKEERYNKELIQKEIDELRKEYDKRYKKTEKDNNSSTGRDSEESTSLNKWYFSEVKRIKAKYNA